MAAAERECFLKIDLLVNLPEFLHACVNTLSKQPTDLDDASGDTSWTPEELKEARIKIQNFYRQRALDENFSLPDDLPKKVNNTLLSVFKIRQKDILSLLIRENLINNGHNLVENIDWKLKWILGSSQLATIREPVCQVDLRCAWETKDTKVPKKVVSFEANLEKIDELILLLSTVKTDLDKI